MSRHDSLDIPAGSTDGRFRGLDVAGYLGLYAFAFAYQLNATAAYIALALTVLVTCLQWRQWLPRIKSDPLVYVCLAIISYLAISAIWATSEFPETRQAQLLAMKSWSYVFLFMPVGWQIYKARNRINVLLLLLLTGILIRILTHADWHDLENLFQWKRTGFGIVETVFGPLAGMTILGLIVLAPVRLSGFSVQRPWLRFCAIALWLVGTLVIMESLILSQTRAVWLAAVLIFPVALYVRYWQWIRGHAFRTYKSFGILLGLSILGGIFFQQNSASLLARLESEPQVVETAVEQGVKNIPSTSIGFRLIMWHIGMEKWLERPIFGWGAGSTEYLLKQTGESRLIKEGGENVFSHLHNHYLEILVRLGAVGALMFLVFAVLLISGVREAYVYRLMPRDYAIFILSGWAFFLVVICFDFQIFKFAWKNFCILWLALSFALRLEYGNSMQGSDARTMPV